MIGREGEGGDRGAAATGEPGAGRMAAVPAVSPALPPADGEPAAPGLAPTAAPAVAEPDRRGSAGEATMARTTTVVTAAVLASRFLGFVRDTVLSDRFGAAHLADAYVIASTIPLLIFGVVGQALPTVFIPQYTRTLQQEGRERAAVFANNVNTVLTAVALVLMAAMWVAAPLVVDAVAPGIRRQDPGEALLAAAMVRIMVPIVVFYIWAAVMQGVLNVHGHFLAPAGMGVPQNLIIIAAILAGSLWRGGIALVAWGSMVGTAFTFLVQWPPLRRTGFRFRPVFRPRDPLLRRTVRLAAPVVVSSVFSQLGVTVDRMLASGLPIGAIAAVYYATRLQQFTYALVGLAIATVLYPQLSSHAGGGDLARFREVLIRGLRILSFVALPVMVGVFFFHWGIVRVVFQHGRFDAADTGRVVQALEYFTPGIVTYAWMDYLMRGFFALQDTRTPMLAAILSVTINVGLDFALVGPLRQGGLTLATSTAWGCASAFLFLRLRRRVGAVGGRRLAAGLARMLAAAVLAVAPAYGLFALWVGRVAGQRLLPVAAGLAAATLLAAALYLLAAAWLRVPELRYAREVAAAGARRLGLGA
jgi:putative peptidoglycan lipid II flippase